MKPIVILRFARTEGPGYFATYLDGRGLSWRLVKLDEGEVLPAFGGFSGLAMMGGPMSVNDDLPWIPPVLELARASVANDVPVIGHCLGGQLLSKALGGRVTRNAVKEIGWGEVQVAATAEAREWGPAKPFLSYHWHGETFSIPPAAERIWGSAHCANQGFVVGNSIGMQCHVEMTEDLIETWCETGAREIEEALPLSPAVQTPEQMRVDIAARVDALHRAAHKVYDRWVSGLEVNP
ncbi:MAG TPA: type 1 glutamine amidotransferase [Burkholderiales bacterium]|nr:type 1 glutamine amidotransferase [Burkholderiales bacterium]